MKIDDKLASKKDFFKIECDLPTIPFAIYKLITFNIVGTPCLHIHRSKKKIKLYIFCFFLFFALWDYFYIVCRNLLLFFLFRAETEKGLSRKHIIEGNDILFHFIIISENFCGKINLYYISACLYIQGSFNK